MTYDPNEPYGGPEIPSANGHKSEVGQVVALDEHRRARQADTSGESEATAVRPTARDTSYEIELDEPPPAEGAPVSVDLPGSAVPVLTPEERRHPVIPAGLRRGNLAATAKATGRRWGYVAAFHAVRSPGYLLQTALWAVVGLFRLMGRQVRWWWVNEQYTLLQQAATDNDPAMWLKLHREGKATRRWRGVVLLGQLVALAVAGALAVQLPWQWKAGLTAAMLALLARYGKPAGRTIIPAAVVTRRFRKLNSDIVLRAYYAAGLGHPDKPNQQIEFGAPMAREGNGSKVLVNLPYGKSFTDAVNAREKIASGLDVALAQVMLTRDPQSHRSHWLWVADSDPLATPAGRTPLLACKPTDIWQPAPLGLDERGRPVTLLMLWNSILVGAQPRQGKSFTARLLALYAALDPYVRLDVFDGKGSPDWRKFALVAHSCSFGFTMTRDGDPLETFVQMLRDLKADAQARYQKLSELPVDICPEGKLTREIARDPRYGMPVRLVVIDECQEYFDTGDKELNKEIAGLMVFLVKVAPAAGIILVDATQKPGGVGTGDVATAFTSFRDNHQVRIALRTGSWQVSDLVLGSGAYSEGFDSSTLLPSYKGVGIMRGAGDETPTVRFHLADAEDAEKILLAARKLRERAGTLSGFAAGEAAVREVRDVLADALTVFQSGETGLPWTYLAARLAERIPEHYADVTPDAISAQLRALGVPSVDIKRDGKALKGAKKAAVQTAISRRETTTG
ncbi:cell division protein FtsK [Bailinhaonella thermotolerans]|uniref:Cell division protein FtsK n=1 Tax=Bailinhaonella thermotolerans TaxID=1070861 RepID=A0A3A4AXE8_9ACTN|nr:cell division protein FtsK [Bailinhaonella thermotolerans]RJL29950.1 cell division protein FtsK [Bailinhaonella thermotolerans]